jgi:hypothetical protein
MPTIPLERRSLPKINGSSTGFIVLIVFLVLMIIGCCAAVYILLRDHEQSDEERSARRAQRRNSPSTGLASSSTYRYTPSSSLRTPFSAFLNSVRRLLPTGTRRSGGQLHRSGTGQRDWIEASSGDEWEYESGDDRGGRMKQLSPPMKRPGVLRSDTADSNSSSLQYPQKPPLRSLALPTDPSISSIHVNTSGIRSRSTSRATSPIHTPVRTPAGSLLDHNDGASTFTTHSGQMKLFTSGTKFSEGI